jgi:hypothetical protein
MLLRMSMGIMLPCYQLSLVIAVGTYAVLLEPQLSESQEIHVLFDSLPAKDYLRSIYGETS